MHRTVSELNDLKSTVKVSTHHWNCYVNRLKYHDGEEMKVNRSHLRVWYQS